MSDDTQKLSTTHLADHEVQSTPGEAPRGQRSLPTIDEPAREGEFGEVLAPGAPLPWRVTDETPVRIDDANGEAITRIFHHQTFDHKQVAQQIVDAVNGQSTPYAARLSAVQQFDEAVIETLKAEKRELEAKLAAAQAELEALKAKKPVQVEFIVQRLNTSSAELTKAGKALADEWRNQGWTVMYETINTIVCNEKPEHWYSARLEKDVDQTPAPAPDTAEAVPDEPPTEEAATSGSPAEMPSTSAGQPTADEGSVAATPAPVNPF